MRIREASESRKEISHTQAKRRGAKVGAGAEPEFSRSLAVARVEATRRTLDELLEDLDKSAAELKDKRTLGSLRKYKELVQSFLDTVVHQAYEVDQQGGFDRRGRRRVYLLVQQVNQAVVELADLTLQRHADPLALLAKLGEIRGLLLDLYT
jgi:uncharacterized protein YaaR (DUF327 family)